ncbi:MAG: hypothetical protein ACRD3J_20610 [Thermoanaerobaculia bacterium]
MKRVVCALALLLAAACTATTAPVESPKPAPEPSKPASESASKPVEKPGGVDMKEPRRMVGTENNVRIDAEIYGDSISQGSSIAFKYDITNQRSSPVLIADLLTQTTYDPDTGIVTISIGSEIPGEEVLPRLLSIPSGTRRSFSTGARINVQTNFSSPWIPKPKALQIRVNFLGDPAPFLKLIDIPEKAVHDRQLAAEIFQKWVEGNETVTTNALPMRWQVAPRTAVDDAAPSQPPRRRRPGS